METNSKMTIEPKDWDGIYSPNRGEVGDSIGAVRESKYVDMGGIRTYDGTVYFAVSGGWVELDEVVLALNDCMTGNRNDPA